MDMTFKERNNTMDYTHEQWKTLQKWAYSTTKGQLGITQEVVKIIRGLPEPEQTPFTTAMEDERFRYIGYAVVTDGKRGWLSSCFPELNESTILVPFEGGGVDNQYVDTDRIVLLPNEPRMDIPGVTTQPHPSRTVSDVPEEEWFQHLGYAVEVMGRRGWLSRVDGVDMSHVLFLNEDGMTEDCYRNDEIVLLPGEPRITIPGMTPEPVPSTLVTVEDFNNAPDGTVVAAERDVLQKSGELWMACGMGGFYTGDQTHSAVAPATVMRWGDGE